ncbi:MAG: autotransporter outer membrane beta-barrel domain-containing protein, partial [Elusimicrobiaceae bacterium]|nr:autotransporter outer membrane beta-barrel domain-containing protein [Elusimicrobiaceae bacterium]
VWVRTYYKDATVDDLLKTDMSLFGVEAGYDWLFNAEDPTKLYAGVMLGYIKADSIKTKTTIGDSNNGKGDAPSVGIYATLANENGWFIDLAARNFWSKIENTTHTSSGSTLKFDAKRDLITGSLEVGKSFTADNGFKVEPKVEVSYMNTGKETTPVTGGTGNLEYDAENYLTGKAAIMFAYKKEMANKMLIEPLVELAYNHEFNGKGKVRYGGAETETSLKGGSFEAAAGLSMQLADNLYWHALGSYEKGSKISGWGLNAGIRLGFGGNYSENEKSYKNKNKYPNNSHSDK